MLLVYKEATNETQSKVKEKLKLFCQPESNPPHRLNIFFRAHRFQLFADIANMHIYRLIPVSYTHLVYGRKEQLMSF